MVPYSKVTVVEAPPASTVPFNVADVEVIPVAAVVVTTDRTGGVIKVISVPLVVPIELMPMTL